MSERVQASMLGASVGGLCSLLKVQGSEQHRQRPSLWSMVLVFALCCWLLLKLWGSGEAELLELLHILSGVSAGWQRTARTRSSSADPSGFACAAAAPRRR